MALDQHRAAPTGLSGVPMSVRIQARIIDFVIGVVGGLIFYFVFAAMIVASLESGTGVGGAMAFGTFAPLAISVLLIVLMLRKAAHLGQMIMGLTHVDVTTGEPSGLRTMGKYLLEGVIGLVTFGIGPVVITLMTAKEPRNQSWFDATLGVLLVRRSDLTTARSGPSMPVAQRESGDDRITPVAFGESAPDASGNRVITPGPRFTTSPVPPLVPTSGAVVPPPVAAGPIAPGPIASGPIDTSLKPIEVADQHTVVGHIPSPGLDAVSPHWRLVRDDGTRMDVTETLLLGRDPAARPGFETARLVPVPDETRKISKTHAAVGVDAQGLWVMDLNSTNGVAVARPGQASARVATATKVAVPMGSSVTLGGAVFSVVSE